MVYRLLTDIVSHFPLVPHLCVVLNFELPLTTKPERKGKKKSFIIMVLNEMLTTPRRIFDYTNNPRQNAIVLALCRSPCE